MNRKLIAVALSAFLIANVSHTAVAQDDDDGRITVMWKVVAKPGSASALTEAMVAHMKWRADNNDPWGWNAFSDSTGDPVNVTYFRSGNHHWADLDAYENGEFDQKAGEHWEANVAEHVKYYDRSMDIDDEELFYWPEGDYTHFRVITFKLKSGHRQEFHVDLKKIHAALMAGGWDSAHAWIWPLDGSMNIASVVVGRSNWAGLEPREKGVWETLASEVGQDEGDAMRAAFMSHVKDVTNEYFVEIPELSIKAAE